MDAVDNALAESTILWLAQTILSNLLLDKLEAWLRHVGLADETGRLMSEVERVEMVVAPARGRANGNRPLTRLLARLKELMYDADDLVDELDYYRLQHQVQGDMSASGHEQERTDDGDGAEQVDGSRANPDIPSSSRTGKKRSKAWDHFEEIAPGRAKCKYCGTELQCETTKGTSVLHNHLKSNNCRTKRAAVEPTPILSSAIDGAQNGGTSSTHASDSRKRKRIDEVSAAAPNTTANLHPWNKAKFCDRIQQTTHELHQIIIEVQKLYGSAPVASSNVCQDTIADPCRRTSSLIQCKMYGRHAEKNSMLKLMTEGTSPDGVLVVPILGIGGIGKTALAQSVYNDPTVKDQFVHRIWIWVSNNFDEVRLTMEMLDFVSQGMHAGINSLAKLQEILSSHVTSNKTLLILDDVWDDIDDWRWNKLLAPFRSDNMEGNVILVTTRKLSVAKRIGTVKEIELCGMQSDDFWLLFKKCSFGDETYQEQPSLNIIGQQIAEKLHHNPLAAQTAGMLLRQHLTTDHWSTILKNEKWKSLQLNGGIMASLKLSYDNLPENLQQCFRYCCLFPKEEPLDGVKLVRMWISQGYVHGNHTGKKLEDMGKAYLADLVNSGFFTKDLDDSNCFVMPDLMHDLARELSGADFATIDGKECKKILPTTRHLSIVIDSHYGTPFSDENLKKNRKLFSEENLKKNLLQVTSVRRLRSLVIICDRYDRYDPSLFAYFLNMLREMENLRLLQICAAFAFFDCFVNNLVSCTHIRYMNGVLEDRVLLQALTNFFHLQVLDLGLDEDTSVTFPSGMSNLVSMQHIVSDSKIHSTIACIGKMTALQELSVFNVRTASEFDIRQLQSMDQLVELGIYGLKNVKSKQEAGEARLTDKGNLEELCLSWESWEFDFESNNSESLDSDNSNLGISRETTSEVLEGLKPHQNIKHLQIIGYSGSVFPSWLSIELTSLQLLHLENCKELRVLPPLEKLPFLRTLNLINIYHVPEVVIPCLEELEPSPLRVEEGSNRIFQLPPSTEKYSLSKLEVLDSPGLVSFQLGSLTALEELRIMRCSLKSLEGILPELKDFICDSQKLSSLQLGSPTALKQWTTYSCEWLASLESLRSLVNLAELEICCHSIPPPLPRQAEGFGIFPRLETLHICVLSTLTISFCKHLTSLRHLVCEDSNVAHFTDEQEKALQLLTSLQSLKFSYCYKLERLPDVLHSLHSLKTLDIMYCHGMSRLPDKGLPQSLEELQINNCPKLYEECRMLATEKLRIKIDWVFVN